MFRKSFLVTATLIELFTGSIASAFCSDTLVGGDLQLDLEVEDAKTEAPLLGSSAGGTKNLGGPGF